MAGTRPRQVRVTTAAQAAERDKDAINSGIESWSLLVAAGSAAAACILARWPDRLANGVAIHAGVGNNGGDAYVVAARLLEAGVPVRFTAVGAPATADAQRAASWLRDVQSRVHSPARSGAEQLVVDGILGTGQRGELRDAERGGCREINAARGRGAVVVALDVPTGLDATTGQIAGDAVRADSTFAFGTCKRAHVLQREQVGRTTVLDIGLGAFADKDDGAWTLADAHALGPQVPAIAWTAHKGRRGRLALLGGADGMAGAIVLATRAALRAGVGLAYAHVSPASVVPLQIGVPQAVTHHWQTAPQDVHAMAIGPGLGRTSASRDVLNAMLAAAATVPTVLDADALTLLAGHPAGDDAPSNERDTMAAEQDRGTASASTDSTIARMQALGTTRTIVCTPHIGEFGRLLGHAAPDALADRVTEAATFATATGVVLLLKGTPTVIVSPDGVAPVVVPRGTPVLATGGSGDLLTGLVGALLAQGATGAHAATIAAWVHGRAAELATALHGSVRGVTLDEVFVALPDAWRELAAPPPLPSNVLAEIPPPWSSN